VPQVAAVRSIDEAAREPHLTCVPAQMRRAADEQDRRLGPGDQRDHHGCSASSIGLGNVDGHPVVLRHVERNPANWAGSDALVRDAHADGSEARGSHRGRRTRRVVLPRAALFYAGAIGIAALLALWRPPPKWVEASYVNGFYLGLDRGVRAVTDPLPFAVGDVLLLAALAALVVWWVRTLHAPGARMRRLPGLAARTVALFALVYLWFAAFWGLNYDRVPVSDKVVIDVAAVDAPHVDEFANHVARMLSADVAAAHREAGTGSGAKTIAALQPTFEAAIRRLGDDAAVSLPPVKPTIFDGLLGSTGDSGFMDPWTHEVNLYSGQLFFERPATFAHEWAHMAGFADESEANYVAVLTCINSSDPLARYSGWLLVWFNLGSNVHVTQRVAPQVAHDIRAIQVRLRQQVRPAIARAQAAAYDRYLRANRVAAGIDSYRLFVRWMTGATYDARGLPVVRS
jgi:hypothetical protein